MTETRLYPQAAGNSRGKAEDDRRRAPSWLMRVSLFMLVAVGAILLLVGAISLLVRASLLLVGAILILVGAIAILVGANRMAG